MEKEKGREKALFPPLKLRGGVGELLRPIDPFLFPH